MHFTHVRPNSTTILELKQFITVIPIRLSVVIRCHTGQAKREPGPIGSSRVMDPGSALRLAGMRYLFSINSRDNPCIGKSR
jgi:hypothetical protein